MSSDDQKPPEESAASPDDSKDDTKPEHGHVSETADGEQALGGDESPPQSGGPESGATADENVNDAAVGQGSDEIEETTDIAADSEPPDNAPADAPADQPAGDPSIETPQDAGDPSSSSGPEQTTDSAKTGSEAAKSASYYDDPYDDEFDDYSDSEPKSETTAVATIGGTPPPPPPDDEDDSDEEEEGMVRMSFLNHLEELRTRIIQALIGLGVAYAFCLLFATYLVGWMIQPVKRAFEILVEVCQFDAPLKLVAITPSEQFNLIYLKVPLLAAVFVASPWLVYQVWGFIAPGLYQRERGWARPFIFCIAGLFILGGLFGYFVVLRFALVFLIGIGCEIDIQPMITISSYFSTFVMVELGLGVVFQMPVLIFFLTLLRIVNPTFLLGNVRYAILIIFILAAVITPTPDVFNMILFAAPMILLFYVGIGASYLLVLKREKGKIPWVQIILVALLIMAAVTAGVLYFMHSQLGYEFIDQFPWIIAPR